MSVNNNTTQIQPINADAPAPKRRRSCDLSLSAQVHGGVPRRQATRTGAPVLPGDFAHVDIMYATGEGGAQVCRGCMYVPSFRPCRCRF